MPSMIGRCFGKIKKENYTLKDAISKIRETSTYFSNEDKTINIKEISFGNLKVLKERDYLSVLTKVDVKYKKNVPALDKEYNEIYTEKGDFEEHLFLPFWIFKDEIVFSSAQQSRDYIIPFLNKALTQDIKIPMYDVKKIYDDFEPQNRVWGFGFMKRPEAVSAGQVFGEITATDPLVQQLENSSKNFCAINLQITNIEVKVAIYSVGTIVIHKNWSKMTTYRDKLKEVQDTLKPYEIFP